MFAFTPGNASSLVHSNLPVGTLDHSQTYNLTLPVAGLSVSVRDSSGSPVTGGTPKFDSSSVSSLPGLPGATAAAGTPTTPPPRGVRSRATASRRSRAGIRAAAFAARVRIRGTG